MRIFGEVLRFASVAVAGLQGLFERKLKCGIDTHIVGYSGSLEKPFPEHMIEWAQRFLSNILFTPARHFSCGRLYNTFNYIYSFAAVAMYQRTLPIA